MMARLILGLSIASGACADDYVVKVGLTETGNAPQSQVPARARVGEAFTVAVATYGSACIEPFDTQVTVSNDEALVVPRDEYPVDAGCILILVTYWHATSVMFDTAGAKTIRIRGRREKPITAGSRELIDEFIDYQFAMVVE